MNRRRQDSPPCFSPRFDAWQLVLTHKLGHSLSFRRNISQYSPCDRICAPSAGRDTREKKNNE